MRGQFDLGAVFAAVVVESFEADHEDQRRLLQVELPEGFLGAAVLAGEVVGLREAFGSEEVVDKSPTVLAAGVK